MANLNPQAIFFSSIDSNGMITIFCRHGSSYRGHRQCIVLTALCAAAICFNRATHTPCLFVYRTLLMQLHTHFYAFVVARVSNHFTAILFISFSRPLAIVSGCSIFERFSHPAIFCFLRSSQQYRCFAFHNLSALPVVLFASHTWRMCLCAHIWMMLFHQINFLVIFIFVQHNSQNDAIFSFDEWFFFVFFFSRYFHHVGIYQNNPLCYLFFALCIVSSAEGFFSLNGWAFTMRPSLFLPLFSLPAFLHLLPPHSPPSMPFPSHYLSWKFIFPV